MRALAGAEFRLLARSPFAIVMAGLLPTAVGLLIVWAEQDTGRAGWGGAAGLLLVTLVAFTAYTGGTTTLAARRQQFVLKRLRMSGARDATILGAVILPLGALTLVQAALLVGILSAAGHGPSQPWLLAVAAVAGTAAGSVLAIATAVVTPTPELAQLTTSPIALAFFGGGLWAVRTPPAEVSWWMLAVPGVPVTQLARAAWDGGPGVLAAIVAVISLSAALAPCAVRVFAWDPRR
ncbi:ABC transporter permease [Nucisporomicrobium flavum]|uniref:ABC transporter permease n=1 Tax=Nucisporomicrobium flavum TaxID=2785915 RepID=UPI0018F6EF00|nr:ABC transporter permease [Nucisporomicrobium flavum]